MAKKKEGNSEQVVEEVMDTMVEDSNTGFFDALDTQVNGAIQDTPAEQEIKEGKGTIETLSRQLVQAGIKDKVRMAEHDMRKQVLDTSAKLKGDVAVSRANQNLQNERSKDMQRNQEKEFKQQIQNGLAEKKEGNNL